MKFRILLILLILLCGCTVKEPVSLEERVLLDYSEKEIIEHEEVFYLAVGESRTLPLSEGNYGIGNIFSSDGETIARIEENSVSGVSAGTARISNGSDAYTIVVSDLYTIPLIDNEKDFLPCSWYSEEEGEFLDLILKTKIEEAGYQTRAGAVAAARFLTLQFPYRLYYFYENGRMEPAKYRVDGEGRYYHEGLYLTRSKTEEIKDKLTGPQIWGCPLMEYERDKKIDNGFDCSGFITWVLLNGGFDVGDIGAGISGIKDLTDLGELVYIRDLSIDDVKTGDLIGLDGHIGIIIGMDEENVYVADAYWEGDLQVQILSHEEFLSGDFWKYVIRMDGVYLEDGNLTDMWY